MFDQLGGRWVTTQLLSSLRPQPTARRSRSRNRPEPFGSDQPPMEGTFLCVADVVCQPPRRYPRRQAFYRSTAPCGRDQSNSRQQSATPTANPAAVSSDRNTVTPSILSLCHSYSIATTSPYVLSQSRTPWRPQSPATARLSPRLTNDRSVPFASSRENASVSPKPASMHDSLWKRTSDHRTTLHPHV